MTVYQQLQEKAAKCRETALKSTNKEMREIWLKHANSLEERAANLPLVKAGEDGNGRGD